MGPATKQLADFCDFFFCQSRASIQPASVAFLRTKRKATFLHTVVNVVFVTTQEKVNGVDAKTIIAMMADTRALRNRSDERFVCGTMGVDIFSVSPSSDVDPAVAVRHGHAKPKNTTRVGFGHRQFLDPFEQGLFVSHVGHSTTTEVVA